MEMIRGLTSRYLMRLEADLGAVQDVGARRIVPVTGGRISGPRIEGRLLPSGGDWMLRRPDGTYALDIRATIETLDGQMIYTHYMGRLNFPPALQAMTPEGRATCDPTEYYFRTAPYYETPSPRYAWLNNIVAIGVGRLTETGVAYDVHEIT